MNRGRNGKKDVRLFLRPGKTEKANNLIINSLWIGFHVEWHQLFRQNYAEYLSLPYDEDLKEFRSSASVLGDKDFLARLSSKAGRLILRPGRPAKENNLIANA